MRASRLLDSAPEEAFDAISRLATRLLDVPVAQVSLVTSDRQYLKSYSGNGDISEHERSVPISHSYCQYAINQRKTLIINDARCHPLVYDNPAISDFNAVSYLGVPLTTNSGHVLGTLCVIDHVPREWTDTEQESLSDLAASVSNQIDLRIKLHREVASFQSLVEQSYDITTLLDDDGTVVYQSPSIKRILGQSSDSLVGGDYFELIHQDDASRVQEQFSSLKEEALESVITEFRLVLPDGRWRWLESYVRKIRGFPEIQGILLNSRDISDRKELEQSLTYQAMHDHLTGLGNRRFLWDRLNQMFAANGTGASYVTMALIDLRKFKPINDIYGHVEGDNVLREVANRLRANMADNVKLTRLGGDEFAAFKAVESTESLEEFARGLVSVLEEPPLLGGGSSPIFATIGVASCSVSESDPETLIQHSDLALLAAKDSSTQSYAVFSESMKIAARERMQLDTDLRVAVRDQQIVPFYQPIISLTTGHILGAEALARWEHATLGFVPPSRFIPAAEESGLIREIGSAIRRQACRDYSTWQHRVPGETPSYVGVNMSANELLDPSLVSTIHETLSQAGVSPSHLVIEVTESTLVEQSEFLIERLRQLRRLGVRIAVDDFGTGYSSLGYLSRLPVDILKIDRSFLMDLETVPRNVHILTVIVDLAHRLDMSIVAEGVEYPWQVEMLRQLGCDSTQGFLFARPMPDEKFTQFLQSGSPRPLKLQSSSTLTAQNSSPAGTICSSSSFPPATNPPS